uniref:Uncharacterized protein n=1 Tax=Leersia perrieri TaxID=77586 RepID=A0A0D9WGE6_9ORYZ
MEDVRADLAECGSVMEVCQQRRMIQRWEKPMIGTLKVNCDGAFQLESGDGGWGYVIRDADGEVVRAGREDYVSCTMLFRPNWKRAIKDAKQRQVWELRVFAWRQMQSPSNMDWLGG